MKKVLVISDNPNLARALARIINEQLLSKIAKFEYRYSVINKSPDCMKALGYLPIDIKCQSDIKWTIENFDLVLSIHCKQIFPVEVVANICCVNIHPGFNPYNRGWYPQVFSILNKKPIGATIHLMVQEVDAGPILVQQQVDITSHDTSLSLYEKVQATEILLLEKYTRYIITSALEGIKPIILGNFNNLNDFKKLCCLNLDDIGSLREHIDLLRALSHGSFRNAYFLNEFGQKVFVNIQLQESEK
jgi:methionyl-tRNA formyltransferase